MQSQFVYPIYTGILALLTFTLVPRKEIHRLAVYGVFFGAMADVLFVKILGAIHMGEYINYKYFGALGVPLFPPIAWTAYFIMFLYILPKNKPWNYLFTAVASGYSVYFSNILQGLGILKWNYGGPILHLLIIYAPWHFAIAWAYLKITGRVVENKEVRKYTIIPAPAMKKEKRKVRLVKPKKI